MIHGIVEWNVRVFGTFEARVYGIVAKEDLFIVAFVNDTRRYGLHTGGSEVLIRPPMGLSWRRCSDATT